MRWLKARNETYLTEEEGYRDYEIRPALELLVQPSEDSDPMKLNFTWEFVDFTQDELLVQLYFEIPPYLSSEADDDFLLVTFWGNSLFTSEEGYPVKQGTTLR